MIEQSEESESQIEGLLWAKGPKNDRKSGNMSPKSRDYYGPRGPKMIENSGKHESQIEGLLLAKGSKNDRKY